MLRKSLVLFSIVGVAAAVTASAFARQAAVPTLNGTVGSGYTITLKQHGTVVKTLKAGTYKFVIADKATVHSFALDGPNGFAKDFTSVPFMGTKTVIVKLKAGSYKYYCAAHEPYMFGHFKVK